jgi:4-amino-4-deoxy-L-arabinose transferase-like glycosyltransferase
MATAHPSSKPISFGHNGLSAIIDYAVALHTRAFAVLLLVSLLAFLPGLFHIPPIDRDEARFAQTTKQMLETGDFIDIRFQDEARYQKPIGIHWLQAGFVKTAEVLGVRNARVRIGIYRLPSLIGAIGAVLATYWAALAFVSRRAAVLAGMMLATSLLLGAEARFATTDAGLLFSTAAALGAMARAYLAERRPVRTGIGGWIRPAIFWTALGAGILIKGPAIVIFVGLALMALAISDRSLRWFAALRPVPGLIWLCVLVLPWFIAIAARSGTTFFVESLGHDALAKLVSGEGNGKPPGFYFAVFWVTFWPGATLAAMAVPAVWAARREKGARFLLAWIVPAWIVLELVVTKLPHYALPLYPAIAILIAGVIDPHMLSRTRGLARGACWWFVLPTLLAVGTVVGLIVFSRQLGLPAWPFAAAAMIYGLWAWWLFDVDGAEQSLLRGMIASILLSIAVYGFIVPSLQTAFPSRMVADVLPATGCREPQLASAGYEEPSLVFLGGTETKMVDGAAAADFLRGGECRVALIEGRYERSFLRRADAVGLRYATMLRFDGYNYLIGRAASFAVYRSLGR